MYARTLASLASLRARVRLALEGRGTAHWVALTVGRRTLTLGLNFLSGVILARALGPASRGEYALLILLPELASSLGGLGFHEAVTFHTARRSYPPRAIAGTATLLAVGLGTLYALVLAGLIALDLLGGLSPSTAHLALVLAAIPLLRVQHHLENLLRGLEDFAGYNTGQLLRSFSYLCGLAVALLLLRAGLGGALLAFLLSTVLGLVFACARVRRRVAEPFAFDRGFLRAGLRYGLQLWPGTLTAVLSRRIDYLLLPALAGPAALGLYAVATQIAEAMLALPAAVAAVLLPLTAAGRGDQRRLAGRWLRLQWLALLPAVLLLALSGRLLLRALFGDPFAAAFPPLLGLLPALLALSGTSVLSSYFSGIGRPVLNTWAGMIGLAVGLPAYLILIPPLGALGASLGSSLAYTAQLAFHLAAFARLRPPAAEPHPTVQPG